MLIRGLARAPARGLVEGEGFLLSDFIIMSPAVREAFRTEREAVVSNARRSTVLFVGDSTTAGQGSGTGGVNGWTDAHDNSPTAHLAALLNAAGIPARADAYAGNQGQSTIAAYEAFNPDVVPGADWVFTTITATLGGTAHRVETGTTAEVVTPKRDADRFDIYYATFNGGGTFTVTDSSGTLATINTNSGGAQGFVRTTVERATASTDPISIARNGTGGAINIVAVSPWNSGLAEFCLINAGVPGTTAANWTNTTQPYRYLNAIGAVDADICYVELGLNDKNTGRSVADFTTDLTTVVNAAKAVSHTIVGTSAPATAGGSYDLTADWRSAIEGVAQTAAAAHVNHYGNFGSREADTSLYYDAVHLSSTGSLKKAQLVRDLLQYA